MSILKKMKSKLSTTVCSPLFYGVNLKKAYSGTSIVGGLLKNKTVLVTGGASGIGLAIAQRYLLEGCNVIISGRNEAKLQAAVSELEKNETQSLLYEIVDNLDAKALEKNIPSIIERHSIEIWINCAGVFTDVDRAKRFRSVPCDVFENVFNTNLKSTYLISCLVADSMVERSINGQIINIASICGLSPCYGVTPYGLSKTGVIALTRELKEKYRNKVIFNCVAPGSVATSMGHKKINDNISALGTKATRHIAMPEEIASVVAFISGPIGKYLKDSVVASAAEKFY